ncbi:hypothetical protein HBI67_061240 [Parastagonospora nodorum]|nr:hypothetical protein HBI67_061240 [Parastagonospora nodorum]KAH6088048.1 hypothetical protein HBI66_036170 [Parastagonospora nodorum]KAH6309546.1 hypothetical protein HBI39_084050 [Parastagonospora nodorum]
MKLPTMVFIAASSILFASSAAQSSARQGYCNAANICRSLSGTTTQECVDCIRKTSGVDTNDMLVVEENPLFFT